MYNLAKRYAPEGIDPSDIMQDAFLKIFKHIQKYDANKGSIFSWAQQITVRCAIDKLHIHSPYVLDELKCLADTQDVELDLNDSHFSEVLRAIDRLPDVSKQVFSFYEIEGYSHSEIAGFIGISEVASRTILKRAKMTLRENLRKLLMII